MKQTQEYLPALTGVRAIGAYLVFLHHFNPFERFAAAPATIGHALYSFCHELHVGVTLFFVLSGLLIGLRYQRNVQLTMPWLAHYTLNRLARIAPVYVLLTTLTFWAMAASPDYDYMRQYASFSPFGKVAALGLNLTLLKGFFTNLKFTGIAQSWSLTVEACFYATAPLLLASRWPALTKSLLYVATSYALGVLLTVIGAHYNFLGFFDSLNFLFCFSFFGRCLEFTLGLLLAHLLKTAYSPSFKHFTAVGIIGFILVVVSLTYSKGTVESSRGTTLGIITNNMLLPIALCSLFYGIIREPSACRQLLENKLFNLLGKSSYVFYLIHLGVIQIFIVKYLSQNYFVLFGLINALAILLFYGVEKPLNWWLRSLSKHNQNGRTTG